MSQPCKAAGLHEPRHTLDLFLFRGKVIAGNTSRLHGFCESKHFSTRQASTLVPVKQAYYSCTGSVNASTSVPDKQVLQDQFSTKQAYYSDASCAKQFSTTKLLPLRTKPLPPTSTN